MIIRRGDGGIGIAGAKAINADIFRRGNIAGEGFIRILGRHIVFRIDHAIDLAIGPDRQHAELLAGVTNEFEERIGRGRRGTIAIGHGCAFGIHQGDADIGRIQGSRKRRTLISAHRRNNAGIQRVFPAFVIDDLLIANERSAIKAAFFERGRAFAGRHIHGDEVKLVLAVQECLLDAGFEERVHPFKLGDISGRARVAIEPAAGARDIVIENGLFIELDPSALTAS
jgi:hypothetical protein